MRKGASVFLDDPYVPILLVALVVFAILPLLPPSHTLRKAEGAVSRFASRPVLPIVVLFLGIIGVRLLLIPRLGIPIPGAHDEFSYLLMADTFCHGRLANPTPPLWVSFETIHVNWIPTYSSIYPPAQGLVLAFGQLLGHPWFGVLLSNAAMCASIVWMLRAWIPRSWALLGGIITALQFSVTTYWMNSYWGGAVAATGGALALGAIGRITKGKAGSVLLGLGIAILANSRPWEGLLFCIPLAAYFFWWMAGKTGAQIDRQILARRVLLPLLASLLLTAVFMGFYNYRLTGNPLLLPHVLYTNTYVTGPTFIWQQAKPALHYRSAALEMYYNTGWMRSSRSIKGILAVTKKKADLYGPFFFSRRSEWPLILMAPLLFQAKKMRFFLAVLLLGTVELFMTVWGFPHYAAPLLCVLVILLVQTIRYLNTIKIAGKPIGQIGVRTLVALLVIETGRNAAERKCDVADWMCTGQIDRAAAERKLLATPGKHLVVVHYGEHHESYREWVYNGADIDSSKIVWAREMDATQNETLFSYFRDRRIWLVKPDESFLDLRMPQPYPFEQTVPEHGEPTPEIRPAP